MMPLRFALAADFAEENWPSMDLVATHLSIEVAKIDDVLITPIRPSYRHRYVKIPLLGRTRLAQNADRFYNRMKTYPRALSGLHEQFDVFHICDHAYSNLVHVLPSRRTGVFCHDLDTFKCILEPGRERRPRWFKEMIRKILEGFNKASLVFHSTHEMRRLILAHHLTDAQRLVFAPYGVDQQFSSELSANDPADSLLRVLKGRPFIFHAGSNIPRKRLDILFKVFSRLQSKFPELQLVQTGASLTKIAIPELEVLRKNGSLHSLGFVPREVLPGLYRRATIVLIPSEAEGFGLPVIEALACGAMVIASDIPTLRETGGQAARFCPVGDIDEWTNTTSDAILNPSNFPSKQERVSQSAKFSWSNHAKTIVSAYRGLKI